MPRRALLPLVLVLSILSCAPRRSELGLASRPLTPGLLLEDIAKRNAAVRTLTGRGSLSFDSPEVAGSAFFRSSLKRPDSLLVQLRGPFGMEVGTFFLSARKFVLYNAMENVIRSGDPSSTTIRSFVPLDLSAEDLLNVFSGMFPLPQDTAGIRIVEVDGDITHLALACGSGQCEYWLDTDHLGVTRFRRLDRAGEVLVEMEAEDFKEYEGFALPRHVRLSFPATTRALSIYYTSISPNGDPPSFAFTVPSGVRTAKP
jgi:hypothetical protein